MNIEIEKKFEINDYLTAKSEIQKLGAKQVSKTQDVDSYFAVPQKIPNTRYLRVRTKNGKSTIAYHEVVNNLETKEWEVEVSDGNMASELITKLGFKKEVVVDKNREKFQLMDAEILIDNVKGLGYFVEIEAPNEVMLDEISCKLTLGKQIVGVGYPDLIKAKGK